MHLHGNSLNQIQKTAQKVISYRWRGIFLVKATLSNPIKQHVRGDYKKQTLNNFFKLEKTKLYPSWSK